MTERTDLEARIERLERARRYTRRTMDVMATDLSAIQSGVFGFWPWRYAGGGPSVVTVNFTVYGCGSTGGIPFMGATCNLILGGSTVATGTTDAAGLCTLTWTAGGAFTFQVVLPGSTGYAAPSNQTATLALGATSNRSFILGADSTHVCWHDIPSGNWYLLNKVYTFTDSFGTVTLTWNATFSRWEGGPQIHSSPRITCPADCSVGGTGLSLNNPVDFRWVPRTLTVLFCGCVDASGDWYSNGFQTSDPSATCALAANFAASSTTFSPLADTFPSASHYGNILGTSATSVG